MSKKCFGILGQNISYTLSPLLYNVLADQCAIDISYQIFDCDQVAASNLLGSKNLMGLNVTIPYKEFVYNTWDGQKSTSANLTKASNLVCYASNTVFNTDYLALVEMIKNFQIQVRSALIIGAGGAARAAHAALLENSINEIHIWFQTDLKRKYWPQIQSYNTKFQYDLVINASPFGQKSESPNSDWIKSLMNAKAYIEMVYTPRKTTLLGLANEYGLETYEGLDMLVWQGIKAWNIWGAAKVDDTFDMVTMLKNVIVERK